MDNLEEILRNNRPTASPSTLRTYRSILKTIARNIGPLPAFLTADFFRDNKEDILEYVAKSNLNTRKTQLCALFILTGNQEYHKAMMEGIKEHNEETVKQEMSPKQEENWISWKEVQGIYQCYEDLVLPEMYVLTRGSVSYNVFQVLIILAVTTGVFIPPRRLMDWAEFKLRNIDLEKDNYISHRKDGSVFVFNTYKTAKKYGRQEIPIPAKLYKMLLRWEEINPHDYLLVNTLGGKLGVSGLNNEIAKAFKIPTGRKIGVNMLRHIYISEVVHKETPRLLEIQRVAEAMGHSVNMGLLYKKEKKLSL